MGKTKLRPKAAVKAKTKPKSDARAKIVSKEKLKPQAKGLALKVKDSKAKEAKSSVKEAKSEAKGKIKTAAVLAPKAAEKLDKKAAQKDKAKKGKGATKGPEVELADDFEPTDFDGSEIAEYEDELKAVESEDDDSDTAGAWEQEATEKDSDEVVLTDAEGNRYCRSRDCDQIAMVDAYCRYHYLLFWKKIQVRKKILTDGKLARYVEELTSRYPDKFLEMIRRDLRTEKDFLAAIQELEIDEAGLDNEFEEETQTYIDEVRGMNEAANVDEEEF